MIFLVPSFGHYENIARFILLSFLLAVINFNISAKPAALRKPTPSQQQAKPEEAPSLYAPHSLKPETPAKQVLFVDFKTGVILLEKNADERMVPSSMTKIMTAYMTFEGLKNGTIQMNTAFPVSERAWRMGGSKMFVPLNARVRVEDLLKGIIVQSGNDACIVIAEGLGGTEENFAHVMTEKAREMGAMRTTFQNASGWPDPRHLTTARDLMIISHRLITDFPEFYPLFGVKEYVYNNIRQWNRNPLLYKNIGCDGIKTGHTDSGGYGMVASVVEGSRRLMLVVNGLSSDKERAQEVFKLMTWGLQAFENHTLFKADDIIDEIPVWLGDENFVQVGALEEVIMTLPKLSRKGLKVDVHYDAPIAAPIKQGDVLGKISITLPSQELPIDVPLVAAHPVGKAGFFKRIKDSVLYLIWGKA